MLSAIAYDRNAAVQYAHQWAYSRNPRYYDYEMLGGDCTNFTSQCLYAGTGIMNYTPTFGWYYIDANNKAPAWTGVEYFYNFLTRTTPSQGPIGVQIPPDRTDLLMPGDFVQLRFTGERFSHTPIIVDIERSQSGRVLLVAAHSYDADYRPLNTYSYQAVRFIHILGAFRNV